MMRRIRDGLARLRGSIQRRTIERDLGDEVDFHVDMQTEKNIRLGMSPAEARRAALVSFGGRERFKDDARDEARSRLVEDALQDLRYGVRMLRRSPGFTAVAALSLALGIGANTAVFSVVNALLLQSLPFPDPDRLITVRVKYDPNEEPGGLSVADVVALSRATRLASSGALGNRGGITLTGRGEPEQITATRVTAGAFATLGTPPALGRTLLPADDRQGAPRVVVLSHRFWRERFAGSENALDETLTLDGEPHVIVGVMPPEFALPNRPEDQFWPVLQLEAPTFRAPFWLTLVARLAPGATPSQAAAELDAIAVDVKADYPDATPHWSYVVTDLRDWMVGDSRATVLILYGAVALILLMASANVANLSLARTAARLPELALRSALGASHRRIARQLVTESVVVAVLGGAVGLVLAWWAVSVLSTAMPGELRRAGEIRIDRLVLLFTAGIALICGVAIGMVPALQLRSESPGAELHEGGRSGSPGRRRRRLASWLVIGEFALALTVLVGAGLAVTSLLRLQEVDAGVRKEGLLVAGVAIPEARYPEPEQVDAFFDELLRRVSASPGVTSAAVSMAVPPHRLVMTNPYTPQGKVYATGESPPVAEEMMVSPDYFRTLGIPLRQGRVFTAADREGAPGVAIVNETFARRAFPGQEALGKWIQTGDPDPEAEKLTIVGIVPDVKYEGLHSDPAPTIYVPLKQHLWWRAMYLIVHSAADPLAQAGAIRAAVASVDREIPIREIKTMERLIGESVAGPRYRALLLASFGILALALATAGIYGVMSYTVNQRRRETGVRLALGATSADVMRLVIRDGMRLALIGVGIGVALAMLTTRLLSTILFEVDPLDPATFASMAAFLTIVGLAACAIPARRASRTDPMGAIRAE